MSHLLAPTWRHLAARLSLLLLIVPAVLCAAEAAGKTPPAAPPTIAELFRAPASEQLQLSPDGRYLGTITTDEHDARSLLILDLASRQPEVGKWAEHLDPAYFHWTPDSDLLFFLTESSRYVVGLYYAKPGRLSRPTKFNKYDLAYIIGQPRDRPNRALLWVVTTFRQSDQANVVVEINTSIDSSTGNVVKTYPTPDGGVPINWLPLENGEMGYCLTYRDTKTTLQRYDAAQARWIALDLDMDLNHFVAADPDLHSIWVSHYDPAKGFLLQRFDPAGGTWSEPIWQDPLYDLAHAHLYFSEKSKQLLGLAYNQRRSFTKWFQEPFVSAQKLVQQKYPQADVRLTSFDRAEQKLLFSVEAADDPGRSLLLDLGTKSLEVLDEAMPWLHGKALQPTYPFAYSTRDGLKQQGYLTLPAGAGTDHKTPLVVLVHGGPWQRDVWKFNPMVQFLASRGYAVLQPNYRGSTGYVPAISWDERYSLKKMQEDVADATQVAAGLEAIDGNRVAVVGDGAGGFLALASVTFEPARYRAAVSLWGIFDWEQLVRDAGFEEDLRGEFEVLRDHLGRPGKDRDAFADYSPLKHTESIKAAVLLAHDENPNFLSSEQARKLAAALEKQGTPVETVPLKYTNFDPRGREAELDLYHRIEVFLAHNLLAPGK